MVQGFNISWLLGIHTSYTTDTLYIIVESLCFRMLSTHISCQRFSTIYTKVHVIVSVSQKVL